MSLNWKNITHFKPSEFACQCGCGHSNPHPELVRMLDTARGISGCAYRITSASRCEKHNAAVSTCKPATNSPHLKGVAADIYTPDSTTRLKVLVGVVMAGFRRIGIGKNFIHVDIDNSKPQVSWLYKEKQ